MLDHLKHIIIPLSAGLLLFSCSSDESATPACEMKFDISTVSRSAVTTTSSITGNPFAVFGDMIPSEIADNPSARTIVYHNTPVKFINSAWTTPAPQYWFNNHDHSFVAIHPASVLSTTDAEIQYSTSQLSFTYTLPTDDHAKIPDILAATHRRKYKDQREYDENGKLTGGTADVVYLQFGHIMSQINLAPALTDNLMDKNGYVEFRKFELSGFRNKATFKITPASFQTATQTDDRIIEVIPQKGENKLTVELPSPKKVSNDGKNVALLDYNDAVIMLPQTIEATSKAQILVTYTMNGEKEEKQVTLPLAGINWESGKTYTYKFTINRTGLLFGSTTITDWDELNVGNIDVH